MNHTCTENERKFLDEIKKKGEVVDNSFGIGIHLGKATGIYQMDFESNLTELVK